MKEQYFAKCAARVKCVAVLSADKTALALREGGLERGALKGRKQYLREK